jgi:hypothetical protein
MRTLITIFLILLMFTATASASITRSTEMEFEGKIDYQMVAENQHSITATKLEGEGIVKAESDIEITTLDLSHKQYYILMADDALSVTGRPYKNLELITGLYVDDNIYAVGLKVYGGQQGVFEGDFAYTTDEMLDFNVETYSELTYGVYRRYVELEDPEVKLKEIMEAVGTGMFKDVIRFGPEEPPLVE